MQPDQPLSMTMRLQTRLLWNNSINQSQLINLKIRRDIIVGAVWLNIKKRVSTILGLDKEWILTAQNGTQTLKCRRA